MGFFTPAKKKITADEVNLLINELSNRGYKPTQWQFIKDIVLNPHLDRSIYDPQQGIDEKEVEEIKQQLADPASILHRELAQKGVPPGNMKYLSEELDKFLQQDKRKGIFG